MIIMQGGRKRKEFDFYPTPELFVESHIDLVKGLHPKNVLDPGCGEGVYGRILRKVFPYTHIVGVDLVERSKSLDNYYDDIYIENFLNLDLPKGSFDLVIGNPPYKLAEEFILKSLELLKYGGEVSFLLRLAFLESRKRFNKFYSKSLKPKSVFVTVSRIPFIAGRSSTDSTAYAVFTWKKGWTGKTTLDWMDWKK